MSTKPKKRGPKTESVKIECEVEYKVADRLVRAAIVRKMPLASFLAYLLSTIIEDELIDAVMDDGIES